jgi:membrane-associated phospholipid phosphatase
MNPFWIFIFTKLASTSTLIVFLVLIYFFLLKKKLAWQAHYLLFTSIGLLSSVVITKNFFHVMRPADSLLHITSYAFPSGHAAGVSFLAIIISFLSWQLPTLYRNTIVTIAVIVAIVVSYSRLVLQVHTWWQVLVGLCFGLFFGYLFIRLSCNYKKSMS